MTPSRNSRTRAVRRSGGPALLPLVLCVAFPTAAAPAEVGAIAPRFLLDPASPAAAQQVRPSSDGQATVSLGKDGCAVTLEGGPASYPGVSVAPESGAAWDLSPWGHVEAEITNLGTNSLSLAMRVDNAGDWREEPWNSENATLKPGESRVLKVIFGHSYGFKPGFKLKPDAVVQVLFFATGKSAAPRAFRIEDLQAAGPAGERPPVDPNTFRARPADGVLFGPGTKVDAAKQLAAKGGARAALAAGGGAIEIEFAGTAGESVTYRPAVGYWHLGDHLEVRVRVRNAGTAPLVPRALLESKGGSGDTVPAAAPIPPGGEGEIVVPFAAAAPAAIPADPRQETVGPGTWSEQNWPPRKGTGTSLHSGWMKGVAILPDPAAGAQRLAVTAVAAAVPPPPALPEWLGRRPPVEGDWVPTLDENFDGERIDLGRWNVYTDNFWDKRTHFSTNNAAVRDGKLVLRYEKKRGFHNDNPADKRTVGETDFASGFADTYGKWVQRYGYFEARVKLPRAPGLWPAFWTMPDRGVDEGPQWKRASTSDGGMEIDILEYLSGWGPYRYNIAFHWDGYGKAHKGAGTSAVYVRPDAEGFITAGLYWVPGLAVCYAQGREVLRWESPRVCSVPAYLMFTHVSGGWDNDPLDPARLPDELVVDYVRAWQRRDLASAADGPKPNAGGPSSLPPPAAE